MSKELAAAVLTQTYFASSDAAKDRIKKEVSADKNAPAAPAQGAIAAIVQVYNETLKMMDKLGAK